MTLYRPSALVRLQLRLEEFEATEELESRLQSPAQQRQSGAVVPTGDIATDLGNVSQRMRELRSRRSEISPEEYREEMRGLITAQVGMMYGIEQSYSPETGTAPLTVSGESDDLTVIGSINPISLSIEKNGLAQADTCSVDLSWVDVPIDPRIVRSAHVQVTVGVIPEEQWEAGSLRGERRDDGSLVSTPVHGAPGTYSFLGFVDSWGIEYADKGDVISLECRDMSAPIRDIALGTDDRIDLSLPIDQGISSFLNSLGQTTSGIEVVYAGVGNPPVPSHPERRGTRRGRNARRGRSAGSRMSGWDHIVDVVHSQGFIPIMRGFQLAIIDPRTLFSTADSARMVYGRNVETLKFSRRLQGVKVPTIEVRGYDPVAGRTLWARYPVGRGQRGSGIVGIDDIPTPSRANVVPPSGSVPDEGIRIMSISGVVDPQVLSRVARSAFEQLGRQEIEGSIDTFDVWSYGRDVESANLLTISTGDAVEILIAQADERDSAQENSGESVTLARIQAMDRARRAEYFVSLGWGRRVAERFSALLDATGFETVFRVHRSVVRYGADSGVSVSLEFQNFVTVREGSDSPPVVPSGAEEITFDDDDVVSVGSTEEITFDDDEVISV